MAKTRKRASDSAKTKAEPKKTRVKSAVVTKDAAAKTTVDKRAKSSLRERNRQAAENAGKPKRTRRAANAAQKPVGAITSALTKEHHVLPTGSGDNFWTRSRSVAPGYIRNSARELKNVSWPGRSETWKLVSAVFVFSAIMGGFIAILDYGLEKVMREIIL